MPSELITDQIHTESSAIPTWIGCANPYVRCDNLGDRCNRITLAFPLVGVIVTGNNESWNKTRIAAIPTLSDHNAPLSDFVRFTKRNAESPMLTIYRGEYFSPPEQKECQHQPIELATPTTVGDKVGELGFTSTHGHTPRVTLGRMWIHGARRCGNFMALNCSHSMSNENTI